MSFLSSQGPGCWAERQKQLESSKEGNHSAYIPECAADGRFKPVQCYQASGYCWCVDEVTGRPVLGTSVHNDVPRCDAGSGADYGGAPGDDSSSASERPWRKCPDGRRRRFRTGLLDLLTEEMVDRANAGSPAADFDSRVDLTVEERVAKWKFGDLDSDGDGVRIKMQNSL